MFTEKDFRKLNKERAQKLIERFIKEHKSVEATYSRSYLERCVDVYLMHHYKVHEYLDVDWDEFLRKHFQGLSYKNLRHYYKIGRFIYKAEKREIEIDKSKSMNPIRTLVYKESKFSHQIEIWKAACAISKTNHPTESQVKTALHDVHQAHPENDSNDKETVGNTDSTVKNNSTSKKQAAAHTQELTKENDNKVLNLSEHKAKLPEREKGEKSPQHGEATTSNLQERRQRREILKKIEAETLELNGKYNQQRVAYYILLRARNDPNSLSRLEALINLLKEFNDAGGDFQSDECKRIEKELRKSFKEGFAAK
jgi:hypothetical protein